MPLCWLCLHIGLQSLRRLDDHGHCWFRWRSDGNLVELTWHARGDVERYEEEKRARLGLLLWGSYYGLYITQALALLLSLLLPLAITLLLLLLFLFFLFCLLLALLLCLEHFAIRQMLGRRSERMHRQQHRAQEWILHHSCSTRRNHAHCASTRTKCSLAFRWRR